jgi:hypothetical protein
VLGGPAGEEGEAQGIALAVRSSKVVLKERTSGVRSYLAAPGALPWTGLLPICYHLGGLEK